MNEKPRTGRILRVLAQVEEEERQRREREHEEYEYTKTFGLLPPEDPVERARWEEERRAEEEDAARAWQSFADEEAELQATKDSYPLGTVRAKEPRSIHSPVPDPPWKRKLRP